MSVLTLTHLLLHARGLRTCVLDQPQPGDFDPADDDPRWGALVIMGLSGFPSGFASCNGIGMRIGDLAGPRVHFVRWWPPIRRPAGLSVRSGPARYIDIPIRGFVPRARASPRSSTCPLRASLLVALWFLHPFLISGDSCWAGGAILVALAMVSNHFDEQGPRWSRSGLSMRAHNFAEDGLRNSDVLEGLGMSSTFVERWRKQWLTSMRPEFRRRRIATRGCLPTSKAVRLLIQVALMATGAVPDPGLQGDRRRHAGRPPSSVSRAPAGPSRQAVGHVGRVLIAVRLGPGAPHGTPAERAAARRRAWRFPPPPSGQLQCTSVHYVPQGSRKPILSNISFELPAGEGLGNHRPPPRPASRLSLGC